MKLMTMGYEGINSQMFFAILLKNKVQTIVDIRELPISRKSGFSKSSLAETAQSHNLNYMHLQSLGSPRKIRHDYREDNDWKRFTKRYMGYLNTQQDSINELANLIQRERCCLLCFEADHNFCHRLFVAEKVVANTDRTLQVVHLIAPTLAKAVSLRPALA